MNILVTGGSSGLGKATVCALASSPQNNVHFTYNHRHENAEAIAQQYPNVVTHRCDFTDQDSVEKFEQMISTFDLDALVNNAYVGTPQGKHFHKTTPESFSQSFENNVLPVIRITQRAIVDFRKKKFGKIINILTGVLINVPPMGYAIYAANKAYLSQLSKTWSSEYAKYNITSNCISPDFMQTKLTATFDERIIKQVRDRHPLKKLLTPEDVADAVVYLINTSQQVNATNIVINAAQNIS